MATVIRTTGRYCYLPTAEGGLTPYYETFVVDAPGHPVVIYEDASNAVLASAVSSPTPNPSGPYAGWYAGSAFISTWQPVSGAVLSGATATGASGYILFSANVPVAGAEATSSTGSVELVEQSANLNVSGATATGTTGSVSRQGSLPVSGATAAGATGAVSQQASMPISGATSTGATGSVALESADTTAPTVGTLSVPDTTGTSITGINPGTSTDNVGGGIIGWKIIEQAADTGWPTPGSGDAAAGAAGWTTIASTTSWAPGAALSFTSSATATGTRYFRMYLKDAAGNVGMSATDSATVTIASATNVYVQGVFADALQQWLRKQGAAATGYKLYLSDFEGAKEFSVMEVVAGFETQLAPWQSWPEYTYARFEHEATGALRVRGAASLAGPWTTVWSGADSTYTAGDTVVMGGWTGGTF